MLLAAVIALVIAGHLRFSFRADVGNPVKEQHSSIASEGTGP